MANQEHLDVFRKGVEVWNQWREEHPGIDVDLGRASLHKAILRRVNLSRTDLTGADLRGADLAWANLNQSNLSHADLSEVNLTLSVLLETNLREAHLHRADLTLANLNEVMLMRADLSRANLIRVDLREADLTEAFIGYTTFGDVYLNGAKGLETIYPRSPSTIGIDTIYRSGGNIPEDFLRKAGVPDSFIEYMRSLVIKPIDYYTCFISYSSNDQAFADRLYADLQSSGVRCWFDREDMKIGDKTRPRIDEAIHLQAKLLLLLSEHVIASAWVEDEVETAIEKENQQQREALFPVRLDESVMQTRQAWAAKLLWSRHIGDFTRWTDPQAYQQAFERLLRDLKIADRTKSGDGGN